MVIAIDGPAGAGKSTVARGLAGALGFTYLDSGAMYRAVALAALRGGVDLDDSQGLGQLAREIDIGIRTPEVSAAASRVSVHASVREAIVDRQRALIAGGRYVAEGRDIGTVVSPDAPLKIFLTADAGERARRRAADTGEPVARVLDAQAARDARDRDREHAPLRPAEDALEVDTTGRRVDEVVDQIAALARERGLAG
jgi:cytidylate kinase